MRTKHKYTQTHTQQPLFPLKAWLHQDDSRPLSLLDKDSVSWDDVTTAFLVGVNLLSSRTTTKKSLCSIEPTCIRENEGFFRSFLLQHVTFFSVFPPSPLSLFRDPCFFFSISLLSTFYFALFLFHPGSSCLLSLRIFTFLFFVVVFSLPC